MATSNHQPHRYRGEDALERTLFVGITAFRWAAWMWMAVTFAVDVRQGDPGSAEAIARPGPGWVLVVLALAFTAWVTASLRQADRLDRAAVVVVDVALAALLVGLDPWVYQSDHSQRLGGNWAIASVLSAGVVLAGRGGLGAGFVVGLARLAGQWTWAPDPWHGDDTLASLSAIVIYSLAGAVAGFFAVRLREAEREVSAARAREEVARTLHDGVLQTLAVIQRRSRDTELVALARDQERDLRAWLSGRDEPTGELVATLRAAAARHERTHGGRVVVVADGVPRIDGAVTAAVAGAVAEALTNAAKHGNAQQITVYLESTYEGGLFCSVKDDGTGFDPATVPEGLGIGRSIRGRMEDVGGSVEIRSRPGRGTEVALHVGAVP